MILPIAFTFISRSLAYLLAYPYFFFGVEDTMFYLLGHGFIPDVYPGVIVLGVSEPMKRFVLQVNVAGLMLMILIGYFAYRVQSTPVMEVWRRLMGGVRRRFNHLFNRRFTLAFIAVAVILASICLTVQQHFHREGALVEGGGSSTSLATTFTEGGVSSLETLSTSTTRLNAWRGWAEAAWRYYQPGVGLSSKTMLHYATLNWFEFTDWDLASYIHALLDAEELGLIKGAPTFQERVDRVIRFLVDRELTPEGLPYWAYFADTGLPDKGRGATNPSDTGRLLIALSRLKERRPDLADEIDFIVYRKCDYGKLLNTSWGSGFYRYYEAQGFKAFGFDRYSSVSESLREMEKLSKGRFIELYGEELPLTWVTSEPILHGILELELNELFREYADRVYRVQERRYEEDGRLTAFSEGAYEGYVYQWIVRGDTGETWTVTRIREGRVETLNITPVVFTKVAFALHAIYSTQYTRFLVNELLNAQVQTDKGFLEGVTEDGEPIPYLTDKTNAMVINAARYALHHAQREKSEAGNISGVGRVDGSVLQRLQVNSLHLGFKVQSFNPPPYLREKVMYTRLKAETGSASSFKAVWL